MGLEGAYEPELFGFQVKLYVAIDGEVTFEFPGQPGPYDLFKEVKVIGYGGIEVKRWVFEFKSDPDDAKFLDWSYLESPNPAPLKLSQNVLEAKMRPMERPLQAKLTVLSAG